MGRSILSLLSSRLTVLLAVLLVASVVAVGPAQGQGESAKPVEREVVELDDDHGHTQTDEEILEDQVDSYLAEFDVGADAARRNVLLLEDIGPFVAQTRAAGSDVIAGMFAEHVPELKIVVLTTKSTARLEAALADSPIEVEVREGYARTKAEAKAILREEKATVHEIKGFQGSWYDERTAELVIDVTTDFKARSVGSLDAAETVDGIADRRGVAIRISEIDGVVQDGGHKNNVFGGDDQTECTTGFTVKNAAGTRGFVTAGHCDNNISILPKNGTPNISGSYQFGLRNANTDAQWHTTARPEKAKFYVTDADQLRPLTGQVLRSQSLVNVVVCHMGKTTGRSCGTIVAIDHEPPAALCPNSSTGCDDVWIKVEGANLECIPGDSGGPWFRGKKAYGIYKGQGTNSAGNCVFAFFMSSTYLGNIGVTYVFA